jgi:hypothetical protein
VAAAAAAVLIAMTGCAPRSTQPHDPGVPLDSLSSTLTSSTLDAEGRAVAQLATIPVVADVAVGNGEAEDDPEAPLGIDSVAMRPSGRSRSIAVVMGLATTSAIAADVTSNTLAIPGIRAALVSSLRNIDFGYPGTRSQTDFVTTVVFTPLGALPFTDDPDKVRVYGIVSHAVWLMLGPVPTIHDAGPDRIWFDLETGGAPRVAAVRDYWGALLDIQDGAQTTQTAAIPRWLYTQIAQLPTDEYDDVRIPDADRILGELGSAQARARSAGMTRPLPAGYSSLPHVHLASAMRRELTTAEVRAIFKATPLAEVLSDVSDDSESPSPLTVGEPLIPGSASADYVRSTYTTWNDIGDYAALLNLKTSRTLTVLGFSQFRNGVVIGDTLVVDLISGYYGALPSGYHLEIDLPTMTVRHATPIGPW